MYVKSIRLQNFRNYADETVSFGEGLNVLFGENASGKTNLLESVYFLALGKSPRTLKEKELVRFGCPRAVLAADICKKFRTHRLELVIEGKGAKKILADGIPLRKLSELLGVLNVVFFSPDELRFVKAGPEERRRFLDISLSQQSGVYFKALSKYNRILQQRNALLKTENRNPALKSMLSLWDGSLAEAGAEVIAGRKKYVERLDSSAAEVHREISGGKEALSLSYETSADGDGAENIRDRLLESLSSSFDKDRELAYTSAGPHRDDIRITLDGHDARKFASQGQQRNVSLSAKLAELSMFETETGESPVLLLDDVLSELDKSRRNKLLELSYRSQTLLTCTDFDFKLPNLSCLYKISNGRTYEMNL